MAERRTPGMDHGHYRFEPMPARPSLRWPDGARVAFWVLLHLEYWELDPPPGAVRDPRLDGEMGSYFPDYRNYSQREYGHRVGIFRVLDVLDRLGLAATVAANAAALERYPYLVEACRRRGWEFAAHGTHATRMITSRMGEAEERAVIAEAIAAVEGATGRRPAGWLGQDYGESPRTPRLLAEAGLAYVMDWPNDDQPYRMTTEPPLVAVPTHPEWDDVQALWLRRVPMPRYPDLISDAFETLYAEGAASGRLFEVGIHPWLLGQAHRIRYLDEALGRIATRPGVWRTTAGEIAAWFAAKEARRRAPDHARVREGR